MTHSDRYRPKEYFCIYTRVSSKKQDEGVSDEAQYRRCKEFGESQGWEFLEGSWIHDTHTGKEFKKRKNVNKVLELLEEGKVKYVVWFKVDRASRDQTVLRDFIEEIYEARGKIAVAQGEKVYSTKRKAIEGTKIEGFLAEWDRDNTVSKFQDGKLEQFLKGSLVYAVPIGYKSTEIRKNGKRFKVPEIDPVQKEQINAFLEEFAKVRNQALTVKFARERGFKTPEGRMYTHDTLRLLLGKLELYSGASLLQWYNRDREHSREFTFPAIISEDLAKRVKEAAVLRTKSPITLNKPFAELVYCAHCGSPAKVFPWNMPKKKDGSQSSTFVYGCKKYNRDKRRDYEQFGKHLTKECRRTVVFSFVKEVMTSFLASASTYSAAEKYAEELTGIVLQTKGLYEEIEALKETRKDHRTEIEKITKRIDKAFDTDDDSGTLAPLIRRYQESILLQQELLDSINLEISDKTEQYDKVISILGDMGLRDINSSLFDTLDSKGNTLNTLGFSDALAAIGATPEEKATLTANLFIPDIVRRQTEQMKLNINRLKVAIEAEDWEEANSLMYRLGLRIYINFNDISRKGGRDKPRAEVRATLEGLGVTGFGGGEVSGVPAASGTTILEKLQNASELFSGVFGAARFPVTAFPLPVRAFLTFVVPVAFITTVPAQALTGRLPPALALASPLVAAALFVLTRLFWRRAVASYTSASS